MPQGENFWNPYRWVTISDKPIQHDVPNYQHTLSGISGRIWCELEALTPLMIGDGHGEFVRHRGNQKPYIPSTSLKGVVRSLAEVVGNATVPFPGPQVDDPHQLEKAQRDINDIAHFDIVSRMFGYLNGGDVVAGLVHFSDADISKEVSPLNQWQQYQVAVGQPKPNHRAFYAAQKDRRKFYHHHPGAQGLVRPHPGILQTNRVRPAPPGTCFSFTVDFMNLRENELNLLIYCLVLEKDVTVTLSPEALGKDQNEPPFTFEGPLRHKMGGAKPHGAGSVRMCITKMELRTNAAARYRGGSTPDALDGGTLTTELDRRTASFRRRTDQTMQELRAMLIYSTDDPRTPIHYPKFDWFEDERETEFHRQTRLKPTI
ncbi:MAG: RAMP superfamily CRISPR-associated protein [Candidatus Poribacteria bacterium]|nr:RAMP superfamily CRISPR-associated protein [Candidatus Poribacteria bacterium]